MISVLLSGAVAATQTVEVDAFKRIENRGSTDVEVRVDEGATGPVRVNVTGEESAVARVQVRVQDGTLYIQTQSSGWTSGGDSARVEVSTASLESVASHGSGDIEVLGMTGSDLKVRSRGSGDIQVEGSVGDLQVELKGSGDADVEQVRAQNVEIQVFGSGDVSLRGETQSMSVKLHGSGDVDGAGMRTAELKANVRGSGDVLLCASGPVQKDVRGSGEVKIRCQGDS